MKSENLVPNNTFSSSKRKHDITVAELKSMPCFAKYNDKELATIIDTVKILSQAIVSVHVKETANKRSIKKSTTTDLITNPKKRAA